MLDQAKNLNVQMTTPCKISDVTIGPATKKNGEIISYSFSIKNPLDIESNSVLKITFPSEIVLQDSNPECTGSISLDSKLVCRK